MVRRTVERKAKIQEKAISYFSSVKTLELEKRTLSQLPGRPKFPIA